MKNFSQGISKFRAYFPIYGFLGTFKLLLKNILFVEYICRLEKDLNEPDREVKPKVPIKVLHYSNAEINLANWEHRDKILNIRGKYGLFQFSQRFARGDTMFAAYWENRFIGFVWLEMPPGYDVGYKLMPHEAYTHDGWTFEEFRGKRALPIIQQSIMRYCRDYFPDIQTLVTHVAADNIPSLAGDQRAGYKITGMELMVAFLGYFRRIRLNRDIPINLIKRYDN